MRRVPENGVDVFGHGTAVAHAIGRNEHFKPWVDLAYRRSVHIVSACNKDDFRSAEWPGHFPSVVTVNMARTISDGPYFRWDEPEGEFSRHLVEFAARGVDLKVPWKRGKWTVQSGGSFAAPHVSGLLSRLISQ